MTTIQTLQKWGNGTGLRLSKQVLEAARLRVDQRLNVAVKDGAIIITPAQDDPELAVERLFAGVTPDLVGGELDWGMDVGAELYG